ncbi:MAG: response regulator transcription factor [Firmicutes bacterium]|nr:response regulator transcription factor [Bacillota bacterium]MCL5038780.1 response regulator transcription factor [Bacillota bacterium]
MPGKIRVLLVDDHTILRDGIRLLLSSQEDIEVVGEAGDGREAVEKVLQLQPDVVLMDIGLPVMNGIEATRTITQKRPATKVLVLTMHEDEEYVLPLLAAGASGYVLKKTASSELISALRAVAEGNAFLHPAVAKTVIDKYLQGAAPEGDSGGPDGLTEREVEVLKLVAQGLSNREIADRLFISIKTVQAHRSNIMEKLNLHDRVDLAKYAIRKGLIEMDKERN